MDIEAQEAAEERIDVDKENHSSTPAEREVEAGNPKVLNATRKPQSTPHAQPLTQVDGHTDLLPNSLSCRLPWLCGSRRPMACSQRARELREPG